MIKKKRQLEMALQSLETFKNPKVDLEQYQTPAKIVADLLWNAHALGDIEGMKVADLACGTGIFSIGSALLGASEVVGVDVDPEAVEIARREAAQRGLDEVVRFEILDVSDFNGEADTVIQNPPFGAQKANKEADRQFIVKSMGVAPVVYSFHILETEEFVTNYFEKLGGEVTNIFRYSFPLPKIYDFHQKEEVEVDVVVFRVVKE
jgi:putative methylase